MTETAQKQETVLLEIQTSARHMAAYGIGNILVKVLGFLMIPFYTHYFPPAAYGILEILDLSMTLFGLVLNMGMTPAFLRCYAVAESPEQKQKVVSTACLFVGGVGGVTFLVGAAFVQPASALLFGPDVPYQYLLVSFASLVVGYMANMPKTYLRALEASGTYTFIDTLSVLVQLVLNIIFIAGFGLGLVSVFWSSLLVGGLQLVLLSSWTFWRTGLHFAWSHLVRMLRFGAPLIFANSGLFILHLSDRFFLQHFASLDAVGIYALGYKFGFMLNYLAVQPFFVMWQSKMYYIHSHPEHRDIFRHIFALYALGLIYTGLAMSLFSSEMVTVMAEVKFASSQDVIPVVVLSYIFYGISYYGQLGMLLTDHTRTIGIIGAVVAVVNLGLNYILVLQFGMMGAAFATALSFALLAGLSYWQSLRVFYLPLGMCRMAVPMALAIILYVASRLWIPPALGVAVPVKLAVLAAFPFVVWKSGMLPPGAAAVLASAKDRVAATFGRRFAALSRTVSGKGEIRAKL